MPFFIVLFFYITISIYQISAVTDALKLIFMVQSTFLEGVLFIISLFLTFTPLLGPILGIIGATFVWEWNILFSALLFFWPYLIGFSFFFWKWTLGRPPIAPMVYIRCCVEQIDYIIES